MKQLTSALLLASLFPALLSPGATAQPLPDAAFAGRWKLQSIRFDAPVDLNGDGVKSADALTEYGACEKDQVLLLAEDHSAAILTGVAGPACKAGTEQTYQWRAVDRRLREAVVAPDGRRGIRDRSVAVLMLRPVSAESPVSLMVDAIDAQALTVRTALRDGSGSTSEAVLVYRRLPAPADPSRQ